MELPMNHTNPLSGAYLRLPEVLRRFPVSKSTWWAGIKEGKFPSGHKLSARCVAWLESDILALIAKKAAA
jgi:prophage regulatory protein